MWWAMFAVLAVINGFGAVNAELKVQRLMHAFTCIMCAGIAVWDWFK